MEFERYYIELLDMLTSLCKKIAAGTYSQTDVDKLFDLSKTQRYPGIFADLAESFGMMMVNGQQGKVSLMDIGIILLVLMNNPQQQYDGIRMD